MKSRMSNRKDIERIYREATSGYEEPEIAVACGLVIKLVHGALVGKKEAELLTDIHGKTLEDDVCYVVSNAGIERLQ